MSTQAPNSLVGIGLYTPAEAARLTGVPGGKIVRWLRGHTSHGKQYARLWTPQIDLSDDEIYLGFRDLMEVRVANAFIQRKLSAQKIRRAIEIARELIGEERPLSTTRFRTDGRTVFLQVLGEEGSDRLIDLFKSQFAFREVIEPSLKNIDFEDGVPVRWWPLGKAGRIVLDPDRSFGAPIEAETSVPTSVLAKAVEAEGSIESVARVWSVPHASVRRALDFQRQLEQTRAA
ncbi:MAG: hypothetical protein CVT81_12835 [Alphaproteobacteria bacterium HGW-Alphaproteobacteria-3]|nr:MAG: hypothetical protein CVT81_12835 [Alphaproteobacteria bacterium HGW-Alphaproteobacteria-3]